MTRAEALARMAKLLQPVNAHAGQVLPRTTPLDRDNAWRGLLAPRLKAIQLDWATFQIMRRTHASLSRQAGIDLKLVADQLGHGLGVNLDVYTVAALNQRQEAVQALESTLIRA